MPVDTSQNQNLFNEKLKEKAELTNQILDEILAEQTGIHSRLKKAIIYTIQAPGKRLRSALVLFACETVHEKINQNAKAAAAAIEMVHTYSLIHDDLPAMDDDDLRRGRPSCHKAFDEAAAILTGDALLTMAFETLTRKIKPSQTAVKLIKILSEAAGPAGMLSGQIHDLLAENEKPTLELLEYIHTNKTAKMFGCAAEMGAVCGSADNQQLKSLLEYGLKLGLGFQMADDILDVSASTTKLGKTAGKDKKAGKITYPALMGIEKTKQLERKLAEQAVAALKSFGPQAQNLRNLANALIARTK